MNRDEIFVALSTFAERDRRPLDALEASGLAYTIHSSGKRITTAEILSNCHRSTVIIAGVEPYNRSTLQKLPSLRCICRCGSGVDSIDLEAAREFGITVMNTPELPAAAVAELTLAMVLSLLRSLPSHLRTMSQKDWVRHEAHLLGTSRVGIIGFGTIGRRVAELVRVFGASVTAYDPAQSAESIRDGGAEPASTLEELLRLSDIVSVHASRSGEKPLRIGMEEIGRMKRGSILINVARGDMVDESALIDALVSGHLLGAGLDVFQQEPYRGPLCDLSNVILTPHCATLTVETRAAMELECVDKAVRFLRKQIADEERVV